MFPIKITIILLSFSMAANAVDWTIKGSVYCDGKPIQQVGRRMPSGKEVQQVVQLCEEDGTFIDPNDFLNETHTDSDGHFVLTGTEDEKNGPEPFLRIYHDCNDRRQADVIFKECVMFSDIPINPWPPEQNIVINFHKDFMMEEPDITVNGQKQEIVRDLTHWRHAKGNGGSVMFGTAHWWSCNDPTVSKCVIPSES